MNEQSGFNTNSGIWRCLECGFENDVTADNIIWVDDEDDELSYNSDDENDIPEGCAACGGPYPDCMTSCNIFDD